MAGLSDDAREFFRKQGKKGRKALEKKYSPKHFSNWGKKNKGRKQSPAERKRRSAAMKKYWKDRREREGT